jgi:hypothetical protein
LTWRQRGFAPFVATIRSRFRNPPKTAAEYIDTLEQQQLPQMASALRNFEDHL